MAKSPQLTLLGRGLYSPTEAAFLARVPIRRVNRWTRGYEFMYKGKREWSPPIVGAGREVIGDDAPVLDFADLIEIRCLSALRDRKIGWNAIRVASLRARDILQSNHPFSSSRFKTSGRAILLEVENEVGDRRLLDLVRDQWVFDELVLQSLRAGLHYGKHDRPQYWAPLGEDRAVRVDPGRAFGAPIVMPGAIRTRVLYGSYRAEQSADAVAAWYGVSADAVRDAVAFEEELRLAA